VSATGWGVLKIGEVPAVDRMHDEQELLIGQPVDRPNMFEKPVLLAIVLRREGQPVGGLYLEAEAEMCFLGIDPEVTVEAANISEGLKAFLKKRGLRWCRCFVPQGLKEVLGPRLEAVGFVDQDKALAHYALDLRDGGDANGAIGK
jgi:hypothetical protein